ncbi:MAG: GNAT family N-acetyltransferase [Acidobacteriota bacterium]
MANDQTSIADSPDYPLASFSKDLLLRDGAILKLRALRQSDREGLKTLFNRCSPESIRYRFLSSIKSLPDELLNRLLNVDGANHVALVVVHGEGANEQIIAVGRYNVDKDRPQVAEVAFLVEDAMQKRGIGTLLLDTLAEIARQHNITHFSADVLIDNQTMLNVFRKAGYALASTASYGITHLEFSITLNEVVQARAEAQEAEAERVSLQYILAPKSIAVVGASRDPLSVGGALFQNLIRWGFTGAIYPVNPKAHSVSGVHAYSTIDELPEVPELVFIVVPAICVLEVARQCANAGVRAICVISAGFAEIGDAGRLAQAELLSICRASGMRMVGPNCMGVINSSNQVRMLGTFAPANPQVGNIAISSQSGALGLALIINAIQYGLGISSFVSTGNKADVSGNDLLQFWESDDATNVILLYLESFGNPRRFARIARRVARRKPIVAVKSGRTVAGARAASSHTAALANSESAVNALFAQTGIIRVDTLHDFFSVARLLATQPIPAGNRLGILTNAGGPAILAVDAAESKGLEVPKLSEATQAKLRASLSNAASVVNPVDMIAGAGAKEYRACLEILCDDEQLDAIMVIFIPPLVTPLAAVEKVIREVVAARPNLRKTIVAVFLDPEGKIMNIPAGKNLIPVYQFPEGAVEALGAATKYGVWRATPAGKFASIAVNQQLVDEVLNNHKSGWLESAEVTKLLSAARIQTITSAIVHSAEEAETAAKAMGGAVVLKVNKPAVLHKSDVGGVLLNIRPAEAGIAYEQLKSQLAKHEIDLEAALMMPMAKVGVEVIAGVTQDPTFGPLVAFGSGGVLVELVKDIVFRVLPLTDKDAEAMIDSSRAAKLLKGFRGAPPADIEAVKQLLLSLGALAEAVPRIAEIDLNPVLVHPEGEGISLIDARIRLSE